MNKEISTMLYIAADKHGYKTIKNIEDYFKQKNIAFENLGVLNVDEDVPLEIMIPKVTTQILRNENNRGILVCGTGVGVEVGANKFSGIRAALVTDPQIAEWAIVYDKCNVLCLSGWNYDADKTLKIVDAFLQAKYDGNTKRLRMFEAFDKWH
jgi:ribose 5-phosphate isomerase B